MSPVLEHVSLRTRSRAPVVALAVFVSFLAGGLMLVLALIALPGTYSSWLRSAVLGRAATVDVSQPTVVHRIQQLRRLETVSYTLDKVVESRKESPIFPDFLAGDRILLLVHGEVIAGRRYSLPHWTTPRRVSIPGPRGCWCRSIPISKAPPAPRPSAN